MLHLSMTSIAGDIKLYNILSDATKS